MAFNKVIEIGNLVADPELKKTPSGVPVTAFRIAVARKYVKDGGQEADFFDVVCYRQTAEFVTKYFKKGNPILICGALQSRNWKDKDGNNRTSIEIVADEVSFVERKANGTPAPQQEQPAQANFEEVSTEDSLPF